MIKKNKGFTLIELLIVVAIIGIVAAIAIPNLLDAMNRARFKATQGDIRSVGEGVESYRVDNRGRVPDFADYAGLAGQLNRDEYIKNPPIQDGWGVALVYDVWDATGRDYSLASGGSEENIAVNTDAQILSDDGNCVARESRNWDCDIAFQNGQFSWGICV